MRSFGILTAFVVSVLPACCVAGNESCVRPGVQENPRDCAGFIVCAEKQGTLFVTDSVACPRGYAFSSESLSCILASQAPGCSVDVSTRQRRAAEVASGGCTAEGPLCASCDRLLVCSRLSAGLTPIANISCSAADAGVACDPGQAACVSDAPCLASGESAGSFRCLQEGMFPDPGDCNRYHECGVDLTHFTDTCAFGYDATSESCKEEASTAPSKPATGVTKQPEQLGISGTFGAESTSGTGATSSTKDSSSIGATTTTTATNSATATTVTTKITNSCKNTVKPCVETDPFPKPFPDTPSYYAVCLPIQGKSPNLYQVTVVKCSDGETFNLDTKSCQFDCRGKRGLYRDGDDCRSYFECGVDGKLTKRTCTGNRVFDARRRLCVPGSLSADCASTPTSTIPISTRSSTSVAATAANPSVNSTTTASGQFQCTTRGQFQDPTNCRQFYDCWGLLFSNNLIRSTRYCFFGTLFDPIVGRCRFGSCPAGCACPK